MSAAAATADRGPIKDKQSMTRRERLSPGMFHLHGTNARDNTYSLNPCPLEYAAERSLVCVWRGGGGQLMLSCQSPEPICVARSVRRRSKALEGTILIYHIFLFLFKGHVPGQGKRVFANHWL